MKYEGPYWDDLVKVISDIDARLSRLEALADRLDDQVNPREVYE